MALIAALALVLPSAAVAQDPSVDQYTPTAPDGGGSVPTTPPPVTNSGGGDPPSPDTGSSGGGGSGGSSPTTGTGTSTPAQAPADTTGGAQVSQATGGDRDKPKSKDERTLDGLAASADAQRKQASDPRYETAATELLRSDSGNDAGMGIFLWAVLGVTALWAVATVVRRRHDQGGHPA